MTTTTSGAADLLDLIEAYAEARHRQGHSSYNAQTAAALQAVKDALAAGQATAAPAQPAATPSGKTYEVLIHDLEVIARTTLHATVEGSRRSYERDAVRQAIGVIRASHGQAPAGASENAKLVTLIAECRDAFPIPAHGDPIENYWSAAIEDPANVPAYLQEIAKRKPAGSVQDDSARLDWLLLRVSGAEFRRIGVHYSGNARRADVDAARKQGASHDR